jgi:hypothetical protein
MYQALWGCTTCVVVTGFVTLVTQPRRDQEWRWLVYSLTEVAKEQPTSVWQRPVVWGVLALVLFTALQIIFW